MHTCMICNKLKLCKISYLLKGLPAFVENRIARILMTETPSTAQLLRRPLPSRKQILRKRSRSVDSIKIFKGTQLLYSENPLSII